MATFGTFATVALYKNVDDQVAYHIASHGIGSAVPGSASPGVAVAPGP